MTSSASGSLTYTYLSDGSAGKESQAFGARMYDPFTARWTTADPLAAKYDSMSPYNYCGGNPVFFEDPSGMSPVYSSDGAFLGTDDEGLKGKYIVMDASWIWANTKISATRPRVFLSASSRKRLRDGRS